jgi:hypothetical protein
MSRPKSAEPEVRLSPRRGRCSSFGTGSPLTLRPAGLPPSCRISENAGRDAGAVEQVLRQTDHRLDAVFLQQAETDFLTLATPKENAVRHDNRHLPSLLQRRQHVLSEHQVRFLAGHGTPAEPETIAELDAPLCVVLAERGIRDHLSKRIRRPSSMCFGSSVSPLRKSASGMPWSVAVYGCETPRCGLMRPPRAARAAPL